ncbi:ABC transporter substrate-binding protein [Agromyces sp. NPDC056523]|uniref:ABC transporter substrate-binding protein n=1 Tax=Agromyces sp. NPDC056523 TaxID=3345850 RepID=UPI00366D894D
MSNRFITRRSAGLNVRVRRRKGSIIMQHKKLLAGLGAVALSLTMAVGTVAPAQAAPPPTVNAQELASVQPAQIDQTIAGVGRFVGTFTPTGFTSQGGVLSVVGDVVGTFTPLVGDPVAVDQQVTTSVVGAAATQVCDILTLDLGPLHLDILGLVVDLSDVQLDITAERGAGNLLGNLLCAVAGLLDGGNTGGLGNLLSRLLGL